MIAMDERPLESMQAVLGLIRKVEPAFKISLAGNYHEPVIYDIVDFSETFSRPRQNSLSPAKAKKKGTCLTTTFYTCAPRLIRTCS